MNKRQKKKLYKKKYGHNPPSRRQKQKESIESEEIRRAMILASESIRSVIDGIKKYSITIGQCFFAIGNFFETIKQVIDKEGITLQKMQHVRDLMAEGETFLERR